MVVVVVVMPRTNLCITATVLLRVPFPLLWLIALYELPSLLFDLSLYLLFFFLMYIFLEHTNCIYLSKGHNEFISRFESPPQKKTKTPLNYGATL